MATPSPPPPDQDAVVDQDDEQVVDNDNHLESAASHPLNSNNNNNNNDNSGSSGQHVRHASEPVSPDDTAAVTTDPQHRRHSRHQSDIPPPSAAASTGISASEHSPRSPDRRDLMGRHWQSTSQILEGDTVTALRTEEDIIAATAARRTSAAAAKKSPIATNAMSASSPSSSLYGSVSDISRFHESWTNSDGADFLGSSSHHHVFNTSASSMGTAVTAAGGDNIAAAVASFAVEQPVLGGHRMSSASALQQARTDESGLSSVIHDAARITDWDKVLSRCATHPEAAAYVGRDGWTALHHACNRRCPRPEVVEALIQAYPDALTKEEEKGWLPIHYACRFKAPKEVVRLLLHQCPEKGRGTVSRRERLNRSPLYYAVRYDAPPGVVGLLLEVDPSAVLEEDQNDESPLALVWDNWAEKLEGKRIVHSFLPGGFPEPVDTSVDERAEQLRQRLKRQPKLLKRWRKANMLLKAAFGFPVEDDAPAALKGDNETDSSSEGDERKWRIVHATAAVKCHLSLFLLACALHPEQARELDEGDLRWPGKPCPPHSSQTALHLAAASNADGEPGKTVIISLLSLYREAAQVADGIDGSLPLHRMVENERKQDWPTHAAILYHFYPRAVQIPDQNGRLPLHRASAAISHVERRQDEDDDADPLDRSIVIQMIRSFPQAASHRDNSGCLPLHYVAMNSAVWGDEATAVYHAHRNAAQVRAGAEHSNRLPLHMAASNVKARESLIQTLLQHHPRAASMTDGTGKLPFHLACEAGKEWGDGTRAIYEHHTAALRAPEGNPRSWLPLHMAAASDSSSAGLLDKLIELYPEAARVQDAEHSRYPLHLACDAGKGWRDGLQALFDVHPNGIATVDDLGMLPLHLAALHHCETSISSTEIEDQEDEEKDEEVTISPNASEEDSKLNCDPVSAAHLDIIFNLVRADPTTIEDPIIV